MEAFADVAGPKLNDTELSHLTLVDGLMPLQRPPKPALQIDVTSIADNPRSQSESPGIQGLHRGIEYQWADEQRQ
jgi:hypothetical protein